MYFVKSFNVTKKIKIKYFFYDVHLRTTQFSIRKMAEEASLNIYTAEDNQEYKELMEVNAHTLKSLWKYYHIAENMATCGICDTCSICKLLDGLDDSITSLQYFMELMEQSEYWLKKISRWEKKHKVFAPEKFLVRLEDIDTKCGKAEEIFLVMVQRLPALEAQVRAEKTLAQNLDQASLNLVQNLNKSLNQEDF